MNLISKLTLIYQGYFYHKYSRVWLDTQILSHGEHFILLPLNMF